MIKRVVTISSGSCQGTVDVTPAGANCSGIGHNYYGENASNEGGAIHDAALEYDCDDEIWKATVTFRGNCAGSKNYTSSVTNPAEPAGTYTCVQDSSTMTVTNP